MSHSGLCCSVLCHSGLCCIRGYVVQHNFAFGIMSHSTLCRIRTYVVRDCVVWRNFIQHNVVRPSVYRVDWYSFFEIFENGHITVDWSIISSIQNKDHPRKYSFVTISLDWRVSWLKTGTLVPMPADPVFTHFHTQYYQSLLVTHTLIRLS